ncbi:MAG: hypothetical protein J6X35_03370 [Bacteroidales bacterium]|nr:hypothetical protein [Bacteroidales bacterium]MBP5613173.1 hypothetical protein [Bacteroidales bacterium]
MRQKELTELFSQYGTVSNAYLIHDKETHRSKGYGFVHMDNDEEARQAIGALNESTYNERVIHVTVAKVSAPPAEQE